MTFNIRRLALSLVAILGAAIALFLAFRAVAPPDAGVAVRGSDAEHLVAILQYLGSDYPAAVASHDMGELAEQRSLSSEAVSLAHRLSMSSALANRTALIDSRVRQAVDPSGVVTDCASLVDDIVVATGVSRAPTTRPDLDEGARLFAGNCATCHGALGQGDGPAAQALTPKPASFHSDVVMGALTPFKAFSVIRFGVKGTAMAPFETLGDKQRWALAFYLFSLRQPACDRAPARLPLDVLANRTDEELAKTIGASEVACVRRRLPEADPATLIAAAHARIEEAQHLGARGDAAGAERAVLDAYLTDVEPIEPWLRTRDGKTVSQLEEAFTATRAAFQSRNPSASEEAARLILLLDRAAGSRSAATKMSVFWFTVLVIVREGFEAAVIIAALLAVLKKRKQTVKARCVHAGWVSAIAAGIALFVSGRNILAGAMNEKLEGCLAFVAVAMLLHAAFWINARSTTRKAMGNLRTRAMGALDRGAVSLFLIAFLAMFRESFETAVFLEALSIDAGRAVLWGATAGAALLLTVILGVSRLGLRLPMQALFKVSTGVLLVTAVMLLGQGIHSFEEVGILASRPMPFVQIEFLGIYRDQTGVLAQAALAMAAAAWGARGRNRAGHVTLEPAE